MADFQSRTPMAAPPRPAPASWRSPRPPGLARPPWPRTLPAQIAAVSEALEDLRKADAEAVARTLQRGRATTFARLLEPLAGLGMARAVGDGVYAW